MEKRKTTVVVRPNLGVHTDASQSAWRDGTDSDFKQHSELCQNGVCSVTWKPVKAAAA